MNSPYVINPGSRDTGTKQGNESVGDTKLVPGSKKWRAPTCDGGRTLPGSNASKCELISKPTDADVLMGRGKKILAHAGNIRFRSLIERHNPAYRREIGDRKSRQAIVLNVINEIEQNGGRFLQHAVAPSVDLWEIVQDGEAVRSKVQQAFRDTFRAKNRAMRISTGYASDSDLRTAQGQEMRLSTTHPSPQLIPTELRSTQADSTNLAFVEAESYSVQELLARQSMIRSQMLALERCRTDLVVAHNLFVGSGYLLPENGPATTEEQT